MWRTRTVIPADFVMILACHRLRSFLHAVNALAIYAAVALLAHRVWTQDRSPSTAAPSPPASV